MAGLDADAVVSRIDHPDKHAQKVVAYGLAVLRRGDLEEAGAGLDDRERRQIRAAARVMDFTNRTGNTVDRWLHRVKRAGRVNGGNFLSDLIITVIWAMVALPIGTALTLIPVKRQAGA